MLRWVSSSALNGAWDEREDLYQEAYARAVRSCASDHPRSISAFLRQAVRLLDAEQRRRVVEQPVDTEQLLDLEHFQGVRRVGTGEPVADPGELVLDAELRRESSETFGACDPLALEATYMAAVDGLSRAEISARTGLSWRQLRRYRERCQTMAWQLLVQGYGPFCEEVVPALRALAFTTGRSASGVRKLEQVGAQIEAHTHACSACRERVARVLRDRREFRARYHVAHQTWAREAA